MALIGRITKLIIKQS